MARGGWAFWLTFCFGIDGLSASRTARSTRRRAIRWNLRVVYRVCVEVVSVWFVVVVWVVAGGGLRSLLGVDRVGLEGFAHGSEREVSEGS